MADIAIRNVVKSYGKTQVFHGRGPRPSRMASSW